MHDTLYRSFALLVFAGAAAACSGTKSPAPARAASTTSATTPSTAASTSSDAPLDLCAVMPVGVVSGILQSRIGKSVSIATPHTGGMCDYKDVDKGVPGVEVLIDFTAHQSPADAATAYQSAHTQAGSMGLPVADIPDVGDEAFGSTDDPYGYGVKTHHGRYMGQVNVRTQSVAADAVRPAATELAKQTLSRLP